ncbi:hypothetical protein LX36DRAFT_674999 [Colletotrichum falcatum]|nr:hypothetical protein LX36DRAFT_674999 [Colletotrichum falcatum]
MPKLVILLYIINYRLIVLLIIYLTLILIGIALVVIKGSLLGYYLNNLFISLIFFYLNTLVIIVFRYILREEYKKEKEKDSKVVFFIFIIKLKRLFNRFLKFKRSSLLSINLRKAFRIP